MADVDLDSILDDALDDFDVEFENDSENLTSNTNTTNESNINNINTNNGDAIEQALNAVESSINADNENTANNGGEDEGEMKRFFDEILQTFGNMEDSNGNDNGNMDSSFDNALRQLMGNLFDAKSLAEPIEIIITKYPGWLKENKSKLSKTDYEKYEKQYSLYLQAWNLIQQTKNKNDNNNENNDEIVNALLQTFSYGSLPSEVMDGMMPDELKGFAERMTELEKEIEKDENSNNNNNNSNSNGNESNNQNNSNDNSTQNTNNEEEFDMNEALKMFEQLMETNETDSNGNNDQFKPDFSKIPKLSPEEMKQFEQLSKDCSIM